MFFDFKYTLDHSVKKCQQLLHVKNYEYFGEIQDGRSNQKDSSKPVKNDKKNQEL
jgi:hypothetical protein